MCKKILLVCFLWPLLTKAEDPQILLEKAVALVGSGTQRSWNNQEIGQQLRQIKLDHSQTPQALDATAFLAFYLSQIPGDNSKETNELCDEVSRKAPNSWQAWMANCAKIATWGLRERENQKTLDVALEALAQTNGEKLCRDPNSMLILKPLMDQWPPVATDFSDILNSTISQQAFVLGQYELGKKHLSKIVNPRLKASGERRMTNYLREHPDNPAEPIREQKHATGSMNDNNSSTSHQREIDTQPARQTTPNESTTVAHLWPWIAGTCLLMLVAWVMFKRRQ